jgi:hypothetical protein
MVAARLSLWRRICCPTTTRRRIHRFSPTLSLAYPEKPQLLAGHWARCRKAAAAAFRPDEIGEAVAEPV